MKYGEVTQGAPFDGCQGELVDLLLLPKEFLLRISYRYAPVLEQTHLPGDRGSIDIIHYHDHSKLYSTAPGLLHEWAEHYQKWAKAEKIRYSELSKNQKISSAKYHKIVRSIVLKKRQKIKRKL